VSLLGIEHICRGIYWLFGGLAMSVMIEETSGLFSRDKAYAEKYS